MADNELIINIIGDASKLKDATDATKEQLKNAGDSVKMLGDLIGITIPDAIKDMLASSELIGPALDAAFAPLAVISLGMAIYNATQKAKEHEEELEKLADEALNDAGSIAQFGEQLRISNLRLEDQIRIAQRRPAQNGLKIALAEASQQADQLTASIQKAIDADNELLQSQAQGLLSRIFLGSDDEQKLKNEVAERYAAFREQLKELDAQTNRDKLDNTKEVANDRQKYEDKRAELARYLKDVQTQIDNARAERIKALEAGGEQTPNLNTGGTDVSPALGKDQAIAQAASEWKDLQSVLTTLRGTMATASTAAKNLKENVQLKIAPGPVIVPLDDVIHRHNKILTAQQLENNAVKDEVPLAQALAAANIPNAKAVQQQAEFSQKYAENSARVAQAGRDIKDKQTEHNAALAVALGYTTQEKADAEALSEVEKDKSTALTEANNRLTEQRAIVKQLGIDTMNGMLGSPEQKAAFQKAVLDYQKLKIEELNLEKKYDDQIAALQLKLANTFSAQFRKQLLSWQEINKELGQTFQTTLNGLNSSMASFITTGKANWKQLASSAIESIVQIGLQYAESQLLMAIMGKGAADSETKTKASSGLAQVEIAADVAMANAYAANAALPAVAAAMATAAGTAVRAFGAPITAMAAKSSAGGDWRVDADRLNFIHKDETILPAGIAGKLRSMVEGGTAGSGLTVVVNHSVSAVDAASFQGHIRRHSNMIANEITRALKRKGTR
jgi:lambda family phage tail tape measure protein